MSDLKQERNDKILAYYKAGKTVYWIAKKYKLSWPRTKRILIEHASRVLAAPKRKGPLCSENGILGLSNAEIRRIRRKAKRATAA